MLVTLTDDEENQKDEEKISTIQNELLKNTINNHNHNI